MNFDLPPQCTSPAEGVWRWGGGGEGGRGGCERRGGGKRGRSNDMVDQLP